MRRNFISTPFRANNLWLEGETTADRFVTCQIIVVLGCVRMENKNKKSPQGI